MGRAIFFLFVLFPKDATAIVQLSDICSSRQGRNHWFQQRFFRRLLGCLIFIAGWFLALLTRPCMDYCNDSHSVGKCWPNWVVEQRSLTVRHQGDAPPRGRQIRLGSRLPENFHAPRRQSSRNFPQPLAFSAFLYRLAQSIHIIVSSPLSRGPTLVWADINPNYERWSPGLTYFRGEGTADALLTINLDGVRETEGVVSTTSAWSSYTPAR